MGKNATSTIIAIVAVALTITTITVLLRCYTRVRYQKKLLVDDYLMILSQTAFCASSACVIKQVQYGTGRHLLDVLINSPEDLPKGIKFIWVSQVFYVLANCSVKTSVAVYFCSLGPPRILRILAIITACVTIALGIGFEIFMIFGCWPLSYFWDRLSPGSNGSCVQGSVSYPILQSFNAIDILTDLSLATLPCVMVWGMTLRRRQKIAVSVLLGIGGLACIASIIRAFYLKSITSASTDFTWSEIPLCITTVLEPAISISAVSAVRLRPLMEDMFSHKTQPRRVSGQVATIGQVNNREPGFGEPTFDDQLDSIALSEMKKHQSPPKSYSASSWRG